MRILVVHNRYQTRGGEDIAVDGEIEAMRSAGIDVVARIVSNDSLDGWSGKLRAALGAARSAAGVRFVRDAVRDLAPDILHVHNFFPLLSPAVHAAARAEGVATVQTLHNFRGICAGGLLMRQGRPCETCIDGSPYWGAWHACYRGSSVASLPVAHMVDSHRRAGTWRRHVDRFVVMSGFARDRFERAGFPIGKMAVKPNSVDDPGPPLEGGRAGIVYAGRLSEEKGVRVLVEAARLSRARIEVIGEGPLAAELAAAASQNILVRGPLPRPEVRRRIASAEALVVPSLCYEGSPMVIAEAFAAGTPVIASRIGALGDLVREGETGLQAPPGDPTSLARQLDRIISAPDAARAMGSRARALYRSALSPEANLQALLQIYADARAERRKSAREESEPRDLAPLPLNGGAHGA